MIRVKRNQTDSRGKRIEPSTDKWFNNSSRKYNDPEVRRPLGKLFHYKCCFCESHIEHFDIDHFRPKGAVLEAPDHPGYYWLRTTWSNLYPACTRCQRTSKDPGTWDDPIAATEAAGKLTHFPLEPGSVRAYKPEDNLALERPLLIDPCGEHPESHFRYDPTGQVHGTTPKGKTTREICVLYRKPLREFRKRQMKRLLEKISEICERERNGEDATFLRNEMHTDFLADNRPFAGLSRYVVSHPAEFGVTDFFNKPAWCVRIKSDGARCQRRVRENSFYCHDHR